MTPVNSLHAMLAGPDLKGSVLGIAPMYSNMRDNSCAGLYVVVRTSALQASPFAYGSGVALPFHIIYTQRLHTHEEATPLRLFVRSSS